MRQIDCLQALTQSLGKGIATKHEEWHVGAELQPESGQFGARQIELPEPVERQQRGGGVGAAATEAGTLRQALLDGDIDAEPRSGVSLQQARRAHREVALRRHAGQGCFVHDPAVGASPEM